MDYNPAAAHSSIHASCILRRGLTRFQLPKGFLGLRLIECRNSFDIQEWGPRVPYRQETSHSLLPNICKPRLDTYSWKPYTIPACQPFLSSSSFTWINPTWGFFLVEQKARTLSLRELLTAGPPLCPPTSVRWS